MNKTLHQPLGGNQMPRFAGPATMMRLPSMPSAKGLDACFVGVPLDIGTSQPLRRPLRAAADPRRELPVRPYNMATRAAPFDSLSVADIGDVAINTFDLAEKSSASSRRPYDEILSHGCKPLTLGGDHTHRAADPAGDATKHGPLGLVHVDAHADVNDTMFGEKIAHGTPFRRASRKGCWTASAWCRSACAATGYAADDFDWPRRQGFRVVQAEECWHRSLTPLMDEVREQVGGGPVYLTFDIDGLDPSYAPRHRHAGDRRPHHAAGA